MNIYDLFFKNKFSTSFLYTIPAVFQIFIYLFTKRIHNSQDILTLVYFFALYYLLGLIIESTFKHNYTFKKCLFSIILLIGIDQFSKLLLRNIENFTLVADHIIIEPIKNIHNSAFLNFIELEIPLIMIVFSKLSFLLVVAYLYRLMVVKLDSSFMKGYDKLFFITFFSGIICSIIDTVFWGYSLDFIRFICFFTIDFKDIYIDLGIVFILIMYFKFIHINKK